MWDGRATVAKGRAGAPLPTNGDAAPPAPPAISHLVGRHATAHALPLLCAHIRHFFTKKLLREKSTFLNFLTIFRLLKTFFSYQQVINNASFSTQFFESFSGIPHF